MKETPEEMQDLARLMTDSHDRAGPFLKGSLQMPEHSLSPQQLVAYWTHFRTAAVATSTASGDPRVAPTGVGLFRGKWVVPTVAEAARAKAIRRRPATSIAHFDEGDLAVIVHGYASIVSEGELFEELCAFHREVADGEDARR